MYFVNLFSSGQWVWLLAVLFSPPYCMRVSYLICCCYLVLNPLGERALRHFGLIECPQGGLQTYSVGSVVIHGWR